MSKPPLSCRGCGKTRKETKFRHRRRFCISCETNPRRCSGCGELREAKSFHHAKVCNQCRYAADAERSKANARRRHVQFRRQVFEAYGGECACCGERRESMLSIDHIANDGAAHRRSMAANWSSRWKDKNVGGGTALYSDLIRRGFPPGFQILCMNCNSSKARNGGVCEHELEGATVIPKGSRAKQPEAPGPRLN